MPQVIHRSLFITYVTTFVLSTGLLPLFQPLPTVSAQQLKGTVGQPTDGTSTQGRRIENGVPTPSYLTKSLGTKDAQTLSPKPHRLIRKPQNVPLASVEPSLSNSSPINPVSTPPPLPQYDTGISQPKEPSSLTRSLGAAVPLATMSVVPSHATATGPVAADATSTGTTPLAAAGMGNSSKSGNGNVGGRSMNKLAAEMPGLAQLITSPSDSVAAPVPPAIGASPPSLTFTATQGGSNPAPQSLSISNTGGGSLTWNASENAAWLTLSPGTGTGAGTVALTASTGSLTVGTHTGTVTLTGGSGVTPVTVPVSFTVSAAPTITLSPSNLSYTATQGAANPTNQTVGITNTGGPLTWTASENANWLSITPGSGSGSGTLTASVNTSGLTAGTYSGTITVTAPGATAKTAGITLTVNPPATSSAALSWNPSTDSDLASYRVYRSTTPGVYGAAVATVPVGTVSYTAAGLAMGNTYYFTITAVDSSNNESVRSNEVSKSIF